MTTGQAEENRGTERLKLRLRLRDGSEFEAEGEAERVVRERREFLLFGAPLSEGGEKGKGPPPPSASAPFDLSAWEQIIERQEGPRLLLRSKLSDDKSEKDACLVLLAGAEALLRLKKPTSTQLAKWLRASGYPIARVDRAIQDAVRQGEILSSGSRRARRYELSGPGKVRAYLLAIELANKILGKPPVL